MVRLYGIVRTTKTFPIIIGRSMAELIKIRMCNMMITQPIKTNVVCKSTRMEGLRGSIGAYPVGAAVGRGASAEAERAHWSECCVTRRRLAEQRTPDNNEARILNLALVDEWRSSLGAPGGAACARKKSCAARVSAPCEFV